MASSVVQVENLRKCYGSLAAVADLSFSVREGEIFGLVGPNGAGKTTTIECIEGLRRPDGGRVRLLGLDPAAERQAVAERVGVQVELANPFRNIGIDPGIDAEMARNMAPAAAVVVGLALRRLGD